MRGASWLVALVLLGASLVVGQAPAAAWTGWTEVPGNGFSPSAPAAVGNEVFVRGIGNNRIYGNRRTGSSSWTGWYEVPGNGFTYSGPTAVRIPEGIYLFVRGTDDQVYGNRRTGSQSSGTWSGWHRLGPENSGYNGKTYSTPTAVYRGSQVWVYIRGTNDRIYANARTNGRWGYWSEIVARNPQLTAAGPAAVQVPDSPNGDTYMFIRGSGTDDRIYNAIRDRSTGVWTWSLLQGNGRTYHESAATSDANGNIGLFVTGTDGYVYSFRGGVWSRLSTSRQSSTAPGAAYTSWGLCVFIRGFGNDRIYHNCN